MIKKYELRPSIVIYPQEKNEPFGSEKLEKSALCTNSTSKQIIPEIVHRKVHALVKNYTLV